MVDLPFFDDQCVPVPDAAYLLFAAASSADLPSILTAKATLSAGASNGLSPSSAAYNSAAKMILQVDTLSRDRCAHVALEIASAFLAGGKWISEGEAIRRAADGEMTQKQQSVNASIENSVKNAFSKHRSIAHVLAVWAYWCVEFEKSEISIEALENTLARAKFFEKLLDQFFEQGSKKSKGWDPLRIPDPIPVADIRWDEERGFVHTNAI